MATILFFLLISAAIFFSVRARVPLISPAYLFLFFSFLYTLFPLLALHDVMPKTAWLLTLNQREDLIDIHLVNVGIATLSFCYFHSQFLRGAYRGKNRLRSENNKISVQSRPKELLKDKILYIAGFLMLVLAGLLGKKYPWAAGADNLRPELINSFLGQVKILCSVVFIYCYSKFGFTLKNKIFLLMFAVAVILEGSRTSLVALTLSLMMMGARSGALSLGRTVALIASAAFVFVFFVFIAIYRLNIDLSTLSLFDATFPLYIEGMYGSYMCLQAYDLILVKGLVSPTWGLNYFIDPIVFLLPRIFFVALGLDKDSSTLFGNWQASADSFLDEKFAPYGGFYYIAEAFVAVPYLGPLVVAGLFGALTAYFERRATNGMWGQYRYMVYLVGFFVVFIKHDFSGSSHFMFVTGLFAAIVAIALRPRTVKRFSATG